MKNQTAPFLKSLKFAVGFDCNLSCGFCLQRMSDRTPILDFSVVEKIFKEEMVLKDVELVTLTGGEPTYGPYLPLSLRIIRHVHMLGKQSCIFTNGLLLDEDMLESFQRAGLTRFRISLYDPIDWDKVAALMARLKAHGFPAMAKYTVTKESFPQLGTVLKKIPQSGIEWFQIKPYNRTEIAEVDKRYEMAAIQVLAMAKRLLDFRNLNPQIKSDFLPLCYEFLVDSDLQLENLSLCHCGKGTRGYLVIGPTGDVRICGAYPEPIGNAHRDTITALWLDHPLLRQVRNLAFRPKPKECQGCEHWTKCAATDCHSATYAKFGDFNHGNPQCPLLAK